MSTWQHAVSPVRAAVIGLLLVLATVGVQPAQAKKNQIPNIPWDRIACEAIPKMVEDLSLAADANEALGRALDAVGEEKVAEVYYDAADEARAEGRDGLRHLQRGDCVK